MSADHKHPSDVAFTETVKSLQEARGSRSNYARMEKGQGWQTNVTHELASFLSGMDMFYLGTANADGQPYIQYRGGAAGFLKVLDGKTLGFADFAGNRQFISSGNAGDNPKAFIFLMDYESARRIKIWGRMQVVENNPELLGQVTDSNYPGHTERAVLFTIEAWDRNCPQHIHKRVLASDVNAQIETLKARIAELEAQVE